MATKQMRVGILGAAGIARKAWQAIKDAGHIVTVVGSRDKQRAQQFVDDCMAVTAFETVPVAVDSYEAVYSSENVDCVYIPVPTTKRLALILEATKHKKHILSEKPCAENVEDLKKMIDACEAAGVQFLDGTMLSHGLRIQEIAKQIKAGSIGNVRRVQATFSFNGGDEFLKTNIRCDANLDPLGTAGDLGWYCIRYTLQAFNFEKMPTRVSARSLTQTEDKVPLDFSAELFFDGDKAAGIPPFTCGFWCSFECSDQQTITFSGEKGQLVVDDFTLPFVNRAEAQYTRVQHTVTIEDCKVAYACGAEDVTIPTEHSKVQETNLWGNMGKVVIGDMAIQKDWPRWSILTQTVLDACLASAAADGKVIDVPSC